MLECGGALLQNCDLPGILVEPIMTKKHILDEIKRTTAANGGKPLGLKAFERETGIRYLDWFGKHWKVWGEALTEAGFQPNRMQGKIPDDEVLHHYSSLVRELGRLPVKGDLRLKRRRDTAFPSDNVFARFGSKAELTARIRPFCGSRADLADVASLLQPAPTTPENAEPQARPAAPVIGHVYLLRSSRYFKIGKSNAFGRRERELAIQLPEKVSTVHVIKTDDPEGIESYWHKRFADKRAHGEWFKLTADDVAAFKRRRFQ